MESFSNQKQAKLIIFWDQQNASLHSMGGQTYNRWEELGKQRQYRLKLILRIQTES